MEAVTYQARHLLVRSSLEASRVPVAVWDTGSGIEPSYINHPSTPFFSIRGGGMGLSIHRSISQSQEGRIWTSSNDGVGATFQYTLPLRPENGT